MSELNFKEINGFSPEQYNATKAKYATVYHIRIDVSPDERHDFLARRPGRDIMMAVADAGRKEEFEKANEILIKNCVVAGNLELAEQDWAVYSALIENLSQMTKAAASSFQKA